MPGINRQLLVQLQLRCFAAMAAMTTAGTFTAYYGFMPLKTWAVVTLAVAEVVFYFAWHHKWRQLDSIPENHEPANHDGWSFFEKWHASSHYNVRFLAIAELMKCWFDNVPTMEIRRGNAAELVARGYFYKTM